MSFKRGLRFTPTKTKTVLLTGGLNEQVTNIELKPGELINCTNYLEQDDVYHGYQSIAGYERYDGTAAPSSVAATADDYTAREVRRTAINPVGGAGVTRDILGVHIYQDNVYCFQDNAGGTAALMFVDDATVGWGDGAVADTAITGTSLDNGGTYRFINARFAEYNSNSEVMIWVDSKSVPHVYNGTAVSTITHTNLPSGTYATHVGVFENRLFLVYPDGHIFFSEVGNPTGYDSATGLAGEIFIGGDVTNVIEAPGGVLVFFTRDKIKLLYYGSTTDEWVFKLEDFSNKSGALNDTAKNILGSIYFTDDRGFSSLEQAQEFGDFSAANIGRNVQKTFDLNKATMTQAVVDRDKSRFFQFYTDSITSKTHALTFTFKGKRLKGATKIALNDVVTCVAEGEINNVHRIFLGSDDGNVYEFQSGTTFDGDAIAATFQTSYHHYSSPRVWKRFKRLQFEITSPDTVTYNTKARYNYGSTDILGGATDSPTITGGGTAWGDGVWGSFVWGGAILNVANLYNTGYGVNMSVEVNTSESFADPHTIHNFITDYSTGGIQN